MQIRIRRLTSQNPIASLSLLGYILVYIAVKDKLLVSFRKTKQDILR